MRKAALALLSCLFLISCAGEKEGSITPATNSQPLTSYVNTFIGTGGHGHTYPGATMPFGMVQLSPDTRLDGWDGCSGYHYSDEYIYGFSHTHLSGTGVSDYGDVLLMPTNEVNFNNGADGKKGYRAHFSHNNEEASPGFYKVHLDSTNIDVALTVTKRTGIHQYTFPTAENQIVILDLAHRDKLLDFNITETTDTEIFGHRYSKAWAADQRIHFHIKFSHDVELVDEFYEDGEENPRKAAYRVINPNNDPVVVKVGISAVDTKGAFENLAEESLGKTFDQLKAEANQVWEKQLEKIVVEDPSQENLHNFYTALYHTMLAPNLYQDVDGRYRGMDLNIHQTKDFDYYTVFSLWDTFRAAHPLYTIIEQERTNSFINTMLAKYDEGGTIPIWDLSANYTGCMIGYHGVPVIVDAYLKGINGYDANNAFEAIKHSAMQNKLGLRSYKEIGFIPVEAESESVSKTLEYAYDDWTIAQMAKKMGKTDDYKLFSQRAQYYKNLYNPATGFLQGRFNNTWFGPFDPYEVNFNYTEANAWQYSLFAPQDISGLMQVMGGKDKLAAHLDRLFTAKEETSGRNQADITGLIGQYVHGNEPSHHMAYLYNFVNRPARTQELTREIMNTMYHNSPDGISGNEDCGQMSAWYVFSALGFYPVTPGTNQYVIGAPLLEKATLNLENGKSFTVVAKNISEKNKYIKSASLNGKNLGRTYLNHQEIMNGGNIVFEMTDTPSDWGTTDNETPITEIKDHKIQVAPFIAQGDIAFKDTTQIALDVASENVEIFYSLNNGKFEKYKDPFKISEATTLKTYALSPNNKSATLTTNFYKIDPTINITLETDYANEYNAGGDQALIDGIRGAQDFRTGAWQGYWGKDVIATIDLSKEKPIAAVTTNFLQDQGSWIFFPTDVSVYVAGNDKNFTKVSNEKINASSQNDAIEIRQVTFEINREKVRYIKLEAANVGKVPNWHLGAPDGDAWIFVDEIELR